MVIIMSLTIAYISSQPNVTLEKSLASSSGLKDVEILFLSNKKAESFSSLYNQALQQAANDIVLFVRDDVRIQNRGWG